MNRPRLPVDHTDRLLDCQEQMEALFIELVERAHTAGWTPAEALTALRELATAHLLGLAANAETDRQIADAMARRRLH